jgi:type IV secretion system protein VirB9
VLVLKPQMPGLDTNLFITTDRRAYYVRLVSKTDDYVSRVAFQYNDDDGGKKWKDHFAEQKREELTGAHDRPAASGLVISVDHLRFDYLIKGGDDSIRPETVFDDGVKTYIRMAAAVANREAPVLRVMGADGKGEVVNYRVKDQMYIVDRLFERAQLVLGSGKKAQKVEITREHKG